MLFDNVDVSDDNMDCDDNMPTVGAVLNQRFKVVRTIRESLFGAVKLCSCLQTNQQVTGA